MRILDVNGNEVQNPDLDLGYLKNDRIFVAHHDAVAPVKEEYHYEPTTKYPNGGYDVEKVIDVEAVAGSPAYDEYEDIQRYILYTKEEYEAIHANDNVPTQEERIVTLENTVTELTNMIAMMMVSMSTESPATNVDASSDEKTSAEPAEEATEDATV